MGSNILKFAINISKRFIPRRTVIASAKPIRYFFSI